MTAQWETLDELRATGASKDQLRAWRQARLLPRAIQKVGLGRGRGSESRYPIGTARIASRIQALLKQRRNLNYVGWELWRDGYPVVAFVQDALRGWIVGIEEQVGELRERFEAALDDQRLMDELKAPRGLGWIRLTLTPEHFPMLLHLAMDAFDGFAEGYWEPDELKAFQRLLGGIGKQLGFSAELTEELKADVRGMNESVAQTLPRMRRGVFALSRDDLIRLRAETAELEALWVARESVGEQGSERIDLARFLTLVLTEAGGISLLRLAQALAEAEGPEAVTVSFRNAIQVLSLSPEKKDGK